MPDGTPELAKAARVTLERRGDKSTGWSMAWKANFRARLHDGNHAHSLLGLLITRGRRTSEIAVDLERGMQAEEIPAASRDQQP